MINRDNKNGLFVFLGVLMLIITSCETTAKFDKEEKEKIDNYLHLNPALDFKLQSSGLYYLEIVKGTGSAPATNDSAFVRYTGAFLDGNVFGSSVLTGKLYGFLVNNGENVAGFDEGILLMREGGIAELLVPSKLGYGPLGNSYYFYIPGHEPLLYDIELVEVKQNTAK
jgi:FKBP-type peptidyl-prolyl cis-trans isomerase FkpA